MIKTQPKWYSDWHNHPNRNEHHWSVFLLIVVTATTFLVNSINKVNYGPELFETKVAEAATFMPGSPITQRVHPRLHITPSTLESFRQKMAGPNKAEYQKLVDLVVEGFSSNVLANDVGAGNAADYHALIYLLGEVPGINYGGKTINDFGDRAVQIIMSYASVPVDCAVANSSKVENFHGSGENYTIVARAYDWTWNYTNFTTAQKKIVADWLAHVGLCLKGGGIMSSEYHEQYRFPWYIGLAIYGDGFADADAISIVNRFDEHMLNGKALDAQNFIAQHNGGPSEISAYAYGNHSGRHIFHLDGWRTATNVDYFIQGTFIANADYMRYHSKFLAYLSSPWNRSKYLKWGQMSVNDSIGGDALLHIQMLTGPLKNTDPNMAGLSRWLVVSGGGASVSKIPAELLEEALLGDNSVVQKSPQQLGLPLTEYFAGLGMVFSRSGFENKDDLAFVIGAPPYQYDGHTWGTAGGGTANGVPLGFSIDKYGGPLIFKKVAYHRADGASATQRQNVMRFNDPATISTDGTGGFINDGLSDSDIRVLNSSHVAYRGGVERYQPYTVNGKFDYVYTDLVRNYDRSRVSNYTRQYTLIRPSSYEQSDYIVVFDRVETTRPEILKRWELNMAYDPVINGTANVAREGKTVYSNANQITISNNLSDPYKPGINSSAHGRVFVKTLLPKSVKIEKVGGLNHEFERDTGEAVIYSGNTNLMRDWGAFYVGAYTVDVLPTQNNSKENFLHVVQTADANMVSTMVETRLVESIEGKMQGVYINRVTGQDNTVVMFATNEEPLNLSGQNISYKYGAGTSGLTRHIINDLSSGISYTISDKNISTGAVTTQTITAPDLRTEFAKQSGNVSAGSISFTTNPSGEHQITITQQGAAISYAPTVVLTTNKFTALPPAGFILAAIANDQDGSITKVDFYNGSFLLGTDTTSPYSINWSAVPAGNYSVTAKAYDNSGLSSVSGAINLVVGSSADTIPPTVSLVSPIKNIIIGPSSNLTITAEASDSNSVANTGISEVLFKFDGVLIGVDNTAPYSINWTPPVGLTEGNHIFFAEATDGAGNKALSSNITVLYSATGVNRMPVGNFDKITSSAVIEGWAFDPDNGFDMVTVQMYVDGPKGVGTVMRTQTTNDSRSDVNVAYGITGSHGFKYTIPSQYANGLPHAIHIYAIDLNDTTKYSEIAGSPKNYDSSSVDTTPPTVSITSPANSSTVQDAITITANSSDNIGVIGVQFKVDNVNVGGEDLNAPYSVSWNSTSVSNGAHTLTAVARDAMGNKTTSSAVSITTNNTTTTPPPTTPPPVTPPTQSMGNNLPVGNFDEITSGGAIKGWTMDLDAKNSGNNVRIYFDGPVDGGGQLITNFRTNVARPDINISYSASDSHGFDYVIPAQYRDGVTRSVYIYGVDTSNSNLLKLLPGSPKSFTLTSTGNIPPSVNLTSPGKDQAFTSPTSITLSASASDLDGTISKVEFYDGSTLITTDTTASYAFSWKNISMGNHSIKAVAYDNNNAVSESFTANINVNDGTTPPVTPPITPPVTPPVETPTPPVEVPVEPTPPTDTVPPTISSIVVSNITQTTAKITWITDETSTSGVQYGLTSAYGSTLNSNGTTIHTVTLTGLLPNTTYNYHITARDGVNNTTTSVNQTFITPATNVVFPTITPPPSPPPSGGGSGPVGIVTPGPSTPADEFTPQTPTTPAQTQTPQQPTTTKPVTPGPNITRTLTVGSKGEDVSLLQAYLIHKGYMPTGRADGNFGFLTRDAVQRYQCATLQICSGSSTTNGYGLVGSKTRAALLGTPTTIPLETTVSSKPVSNGTGNIKLTRTLSFGMRGTDVTTLQTFLISKGYLTGASATGYFGSLTRQAVQKFQCDKLRICSGSTTTNGYGVVGPKTRGGDGEVGAWFYVHFHALM